MNKKIIAIDLGTGNSAVAITEGDKTTIIPAKDTGSMTTPSIVAFTKNGDILVGNGAARQRITNPKNTVYAIKRFMGKTVTEAKDEISKVPYEVVAGPNDQCRVKINDKLYSPEEISAKILEKLKKDAEAFLGYTPEKCIVTVPAYFNAAAKEATKNAATIAGLECVRVLSEPTAACLCHGLQKKKSGKIAIADIGCGTSDLSIIDIADGVFEVIGINGDNHLGGWDLDNAVAQWIIDEFKRENGIDLSNDPMAMQRIEEEAEKAKCALSTTPTYSINLPFITADATGPKHIAMELTKAKLEQLISPIVDRLDAPVKALLADTKVDVDEVVLVGGSCRVPMIQEKIKSLFGKEPSKNANLDTVVAEGAAIQASIMNGEQVGTDVLLLDVTPLDIGIETMGQVFTTMIEKNTTIPTKKSQIFSTAVDYQPAVTIRIATGNRPMFTDNKLIGNFNLDGIPPAPRGVPQIEITVDVDANNIISVSAKDLGTGKEQHITITNGSGLSKEEIERMKSEAEAHAAEDKKKLEVINEKNAADGLCFSIEKAVKDAGDKLTEDEKKSINDEIAKVKDALKTDDIAKVKSAKEALDKAWQPLVGKIYQGTGNPTGQQFTKEQFEQMMKDPKFAQMFGGNTFANGSNPFANFTSGQAAPNKSASAGDDTIDVDAK